MSVTASAIIAATFMTAESTEAATHKVKRGDSLWDVAQKYNTNVSQLKEWNNLSDNYVYLNQVLEVGDDGHAVVEKAAAVPVEINTYTSKPGDTLSGIAFEYGLSARDLMSWNGLDSTLIYPGNVFIIGGVENFAAIGKGDVVIVEVDKDKIVTTGENVDEETTEDVVPEVEPTPEPTPETEVKVEEEVEVEVDPTPKPEVEAEEVVEVDPTPEPEIDAEEIVEVETTPEPTPEPEVEVEEVVEVDMTPEVEIEVEEEVEVPQPEETPEVEQPEVETTEPDEAPEIEEPEVDAIEPTPTPKPDKPKPEAKPEAEKPKPEPKPEVKPEVEKPEPVKPTPVPKPEAKPEKKPEPVKPKPTPKPEAPKPVTPKPNPQPTQPTVPKPDVLDKTTKLINAAKSVVGTPYVWGGSNVHGFDCSGFIHWAHVEAGIDISRLTTDGYDTRSYEISKSELKAGDLVFFAGTYRPGISHMGIYVGNNQFIHAGSTNGIEVSSLDSNYWSKHFDSFKRFY